MQYFPQGTVELRLFGGWLTGSAWSLGKFVVNSAVVSCLEITAYQIKYSTLLWLLERQIRSGRKVWTQVHNVNNNSRTSNCQCSLLSKKEKIYIYSGFPPCPDGTPSKLIRISGVLPYLFFSSRDSDSNNLLDFSGNVSCMISCLRRSVKEIVDLLGRYAA